MFLKVYKKIVVPLQLLLWANRGINIQNGSLAVKQK